MSLYNMLYGVSPIAFLVLPVLGKHPDEYPRFRNCFIGDTERLGTEGKLIVYTRTGGGNRDDYAEENEAIKAMPGFLFDYDDDFDSTFSNWVFDVPEKWKADVDLVLAGKPRETAEAYKELILRTFPKIQDKLRAKLYASNVTEVNAG